MNTHTQPKPGATDRTIALALGVLILIGLFYAGQVVFLGTMMFAAAWVILKRIPGFHFFATRAPVLVDAAATLGAFVLLQLLGVNSMTVFLATAVAGLEVSIWVAAIRAKHLTSHVREGVVG